MTRILVLTTTTDAEFDPAEFTNGAQVTGGGDDIKVHEYGELDEDTEIITFEDGTETRVFDIEGIDNVNVIDLDDEEEAFQRIANDVISKLYDRADSIGTSRNEMFDRFFDFFQDA